MLGFVFVLLGHAGYWAWRGPQIAVGSGASCCEEVVSFPVQYFGEQNYMMGLSYALAAAFTVYAFLRLLGNRREGVGGVFGGLTLTGVLYFAAYFMVGCCGSPMLPVYIGVLGPRFMGFAKPLTLLLTTLSVALGFLWLRRRRKGSSGDCCACHEKGKEQ